MKSIQITGRGRYLPKTKIDNKYLETIFNQNQEYIYEVSGIENRWYEQELTIEEMAYEASKSALENSRISKNEIDYIIVASSSSNNIMPGISYKVQSMLGINNNCMCLDILGGCSGYINAFDIARNYIALEKVKNALVIGVDKLSEIINNEDFSTKILLGDGAGATIISKCEEEKRYFSYIESKGEDSDLLVYKVGKKIEMQGKKIYKYAVKDVPNVITKTLNLANLDISEIDKIILHQSNQRIIDKISEKLGVENKKVFSNINKIGNTFCASIPIALSCIEIKENEKILLCGYGGGLNTGCIILNV
mgnify:CR=1 FL=1